LRSSSICRHWGNLRRDWDVANNNSAVGRNGIRVDNSQGLVIGGTQHHPGRGHSRQCVRLQVAQNKAVGSKQPTSIFSTKSFSLSGWCAISMILPIRRSSSSGLMVFLAVFFTPLPSAASSPATFPRGAGGAAFAASFSRLWQLPSRHASLSSEGRACFATSAERR
jgi:hypothetical protein